MGTVEKLFLHESLVRVLVLDDNRIGTDAFINIMHAVRKCTRIHELSFARCGITIDANEDAAKDLKASMNQNCSIYKLNLEGNVVHDAVRTDLAAELDKNQGIVEKIFPMYEGRGERAIHELSLAGRGITSLDFLTKFLREHPQIKRVDLDIEENVADQEFKKVAEHLRGNT